jgi:tol-pal system protein YbgF
MLNGIPTLTIGKMIAMVLRFAWAATLAVLGTIMFADAPARAQDAELVVRVNRLENQVRQLSGQIEQLQFQNKRLEDQFAKYQQDVEYRFQELKGGAKPTAGVAPTPAPAGPAGAKPAKRSDAFDPAAQPAAPGAPRTLGALPDGALPAGRAAGPATIGTLLDEEEDGPIDLNTMSRAHSGAQAAAPAGGLSTPGLPPSSVPVAPGSVQGVNPATVQGVNPRQVAPGVTGSPPQVATAGTGSPRDSYDLAYGLVLQRQYDQAEMAFRQFLQSNPRDKLVPDATFWLGETYFRRQRYPDAVEQYLKIYKTFGSSRVAPESMLKLSLSLRGMNQPEQACATLAEIGRKYPEASAEVKAGVQREQKRGNC